MNDTMNDILESVHFEEFFEALKRSMRNSIRMKKAWLNPSAKRIVASLLGGDALQKAAVKWREENPEKARALRQKSSKKARIAAERQREEHRWEFLSSRENGLAALAQWREEHPDEFRDNWKKAITTLAQWKKENPEQRRAHLARAQVKGRKAHTWKAAQRYTEQLQLIKPFIPAAGIRTNILKALVPQWSRHQLKWFLKRAVEYGDLVRVGNTLKTTYFNKWETM